MIWQTTRFRIALARPQVMANVMTPNLAQLRFVEAIQRELNLTREQATTLYVQEERTKAGIQFSMP